MNVLRLLFFALLEIVLGPVQLLGALLYAARIRFVNRSRSISGTAYEPFMARLLLHEIDARPDPAAAQIARHLPALTPTVLGLLFGTMVRAAQWSGYRGSFFSFPGPRPSTIMTMISHRTDFFDCAIGEAAAADAPIRQFVVLGAGWDTRFYSALPDGTDLRKVARKRGIRLFEVDQPPTQELKVRALRDGRVPADHVVFAPTDFQQRSWLESLHEQGFDPQLPTFVLWEGVTMYLDDDAVQKTLREISQLAPGSRVAFDFFSRELVFAQRPYRVLGLYARYALGSFYGESWHFGISTQPPLEIKATEFIGVQGLQVQRLEPLGVANAAKASFGGLLLAGVPESTS